MQPQQEAVQLTLRQRVGALELIGVLGGQHEERRAQRPGLAVYRHLPVAHRFEEGALGARRGTVDLVGEDDVGEDRARLEDEGALALVVDADAEQVAGQQVRRELDAVKGARQAAGDGLGQQRLADAGHVFEQEVAFGEQGDEGHLDHVGLAEKDGRDVVAQPAQQDVRVGGVHVRGHPKGLVEGRESGCE